MLCVYSPLWGLDKVAMELLRLHVNDNGKARQGQSGGGGGDGNNGVESPSKRSAGKGEDEEGETTLECLAQAAAAAAGEADIETLVHHSGGRGCCEFRCSMLLSVPRASLQNKPLPHHLNDSSNIQFSEQFGASVQWWRRNLLHG